MYIQGAVSIEDWAIKQNKTVRAHEVHPYMVLKMTFQLVSFPKKAKRNYVCGPRS